jgi:hypothetical protein
MTFINIVEHLLSFSLNRLHPTTRMLTNETITINSDMTRTTPSCGFVFRICDIMFGTIVTHWHPNDRDDIVRISV